MTPSDWTSPSFTPVLRTRSLDEGGQPAALPSTGTPLDPETRIYARSASDDKASIVAMMAALDAITAAGLRPRSNVRFVVPSATAEKCLFSVQLSFLGPPAGSESVIAARRELDASSVDAIRTRVSRRHRPGRRCPRLDATRGGGPILGLALPVHLAVARSVPLRSRCTKPLTAGARRIRRSTTSQRRSERGAACLLCTKSVGLSRCRCGGDSGLLRSVVAF